MFRPGQVWDDAAGRPMQDPIGGVLYDQGTYYWFGENKTRTTSGCRLK